MSSNLVNSVSLYLTTHNHIEELAQKLQECSIEEIVSENNALTQQNLWDEVLIDLFYTELNNRLLEETTFSFLLDDEKVTVMIGFNDTYLVDPKYSQLYLPESARFDKSGILNELLSFPELNIGISGENIISLGELDFDESVDRIYYPVILECVSGFGTFLNIYRGLQSGEPVIQDPYLDRLINQIVDVDELEDILDNGGMFYDNDELLNAVPDE